jgi:hypothetical protein
MLKDLGIQILAQVVASIMVVIILYLAFEFTKKKTPCGCHSKENTPAGSEVDKIVSASAKMPNIFGGMFSLSDGGNPFIQ